MEKSSRPAHLESAVSSLITELQGMPVTPHVRELRAKAVTYGRVIANWATYPPTAPQIQAMLECVTELENKVSSARTTEVSHVGKKPQPPRRAEPMPSVPPDGVAWSAAVEGTGTRSRSRISDAKTMPPPAAASSRPPGRSARTTSVPPKATIPPPISAPRTIDTPTPALLQGRRNR